MQWLQGKAINNSLEARAIGLKLLCLLDLPFKRNKAFQSHISALLHCSKAGRGDKTAAVKCKDEYMAPVIPEGPAYLERHRDL